jgi:exodeoxyribonuclease VII large subunit
LEQFALNFTPARRVFSVAELNGAIASLLTTEFDDIWVAGEISGTKILTSGHCYFTLKEKDSQIRCALFKGIMRFLKFKPLDGVAVLARGRVDVFAPRGEYQIIVEQLEPQGHGALQLAFEQLKRKLGDEGLFESARKRPLPVFPRRIGIVTSPRGAVIADMLHVMERRFPGLHIRLFPALVQGEGAADELVRGLNFFSQSAWAEVVILARGGGSLEDLWAFNEERVARAIAACSVPVISAVGHETDFTIADFVADLRAPTPSAAAELVICTRDELLGRIADGTRRVLQALRYRLALLLRRIEQQGIGRPEAILHRSINRRYQMLDDKTARMRDALRRAITARGLRRRALEERLRFFDVRPRLERNRNRLDSAHAAAVRVIGLRLAGKRSRLENCVARLEQLSPLRVLERGYAIVQMKNGGILKDPAVVSPGAPLEIRLARGSLEAEAK